MAGVGFQLARMARDGGVGGIAGAALHGAVISAGPWLITAAAMTLLGGWTAQHLDAAGMRMVQTVLVYAFSLSALVAAPIGVLATRLVADRLFAQEPDSIPGIVVAALAAGGVLGLVAGLILFVELGRMPVLPALIAAAALAWLTQVWIAAPLLTALRRYRAVPGAYLGGAAAAGLALLALRPGDPVVVLGIVTAGCGVTLAAVIVLLRRHFTAPAILPRADVLPPRLALLVALSGVAGVAAIWADKWLLWQAPESVAVLGMLRLNPINDLGSFLGLLTMVPGLTLVLIVSETRFDIAFGDVMARCTGTSTLDRIEEAHRDLVTTLFAGLRLIVLVQAIVAALAWVLAVPLLDLIGADIRAIFAFRQTAFGTIFHLVAIAATVVLAYYDLFGRILLTWGAFALASALATLGQWDAGFAAFGWGYMSGAIVGAAVGVALAGEATANLVYLLFVGNNPAVVGAGGRVL
ncbi:hypothetical protein ASG29_15305 [Sphingomonas sp. Leaf412]|uniref:exopolysaccharide Pel transporter PelG n=1 Tax=Sphingomonas sp. Leaf412 TaxID=1736370 RepID=UPI0006F3A686|nr:exopolysaccharide Pel transporter PelG [Sphingomonas sp. Leaf412]KQT31325.1 hypothetical protein ASG29_15305 [Sphingomonas sp. Leaf412]